MRYLMVKVEVTLLKHAASHRLAQDPRTALVFTSFSILLHQRLTHIKYIQPGTFPSCEKDNLLHYISQPRFHVLPPEPAP